MPCHAILQRQDEWVALQSDTPLAALVRSRHSFKMASRIENQGPVKRSVTIAGHPTSISLEPIFWDGLRRAADAMQLPVNALVAQIDAHRIADTDPANLASAIRVWLYSRESANYSH